jgi:hypothetical protein
MTLQDVINILFWICVIGLEIFVVLAILREIFPAIKDIIG